MSRKDHINQELQRLLPLIIERFQPALDDAEIVKIQTEAEIERRMEMAGDELPMLTAEEQALEWEKANI